MDEKVASVLIQRLKSKLMSAGFSVLRTSIDKDSYHRSWWISIASWAQGRPRVGLWIDNDEERGLGIWIGFFSHAQMMAGLLKELSDNRYKYRTVLVDPGPSLSAIRQIKEETRGKEILIHELSPKIDQNHYIGFYQHVFNNFDEHETIDRAANLIIDIRSALEPELVDYDKIIGSVSDTERDQLIRARVGHAKFCKTIRKKWNRCAVTECSVSEALRASHIVSWARSKKDRLNPANGLLLVATIDALFDRGLISFKDDGEIIISKRLSDLDQKALGISKTMKIRDRLNSDHRRFLRQHREYHRARLEE